MTEKMNNENKVEQTNCKKLYVEYGEYIDPEQDSFAKSIEFERSLKINKNRKGLEALI